MTFLRPQLKFLIRWAILAASLFFLASVLRENWKTLVSIQLEPAAWACLTIALGVTLLAHLCAGWVWSRILYELDQPTQRTWIIHAYLKTTIAKYIPGNIWHYYGRINAAIEAGAESSVAIVSVLLEPILMVVAALLLMVLCSQQLAQQYGHFIVIAQWLGMGTALVLLQPTVLNFAIRYLTQLKQSTFQASPSASASAQLLTYPLIPVLGEIGFLVLRSAGFVLTLLAFQSFSLEQLPLVIGVFSGAWLVGMVLPGAPGGLGVFETIAIALLSSVFPQAIVLAAVACYRFMSILAEALAAGLAWVSNPIRLLF